MYVLIPLQIKCSCTYGNTLGKFILLQYVLRPEQQELEIHTRMDLIMCSKFPADPATDGTRQSNFAILDFTRKIALIGGTGYTGEMKRNFLCIEFHITCEQRYLPMHCSANVGDKDDTAIFFGLSGTGKQLYQQIQKKINW
jgi:phosphoenolpyruvate carboxykinase (ATP)